MREHGLRCPNCYSRNIECDGRMHRCLDCGYDDRASEQATLDQKCSLCHITMATGTCLHLLDLGDGRVVIPRKVWEGLVEDRLRLRELSGNEEELANVPNGPKEAPAP